MDTELNSCLMLAVNLDTPVDLGCVFDDEDLKDTGIEFDSHVTLLYAQGRDIPRQGLMKDISIILGDSFPEFLNVCKKGIEKPVLELFELGNFENDSDYVVLKMKPGSRLYEWLGKINSGLKEKYKVSSDFATYTPHMTLAELQPGTSGKYLESEKLRLVLKDTMMNFEDLFISYGGNNEVEDRKQYHLTHFKSVERYFRLQRLKENDKKLRE